MRYSFLAPLREWGRRLHQQGLLPQLPLKVRRIRLSAPPGIQERVRIGFVSDIHYGQFVTESRMAQAAQAFTHAGVDLLILGGDLISAYDVEMEAIRTVLRAFASVPAPAGRWVVPGNHDSSVGARGFVPFADEEGYQDLTNRGVRVEVGRGALYLAGLDELMNGTPDPSAAYRDHQGEPVLLVSHYPDAAYQCLRGEHPTWLVLAGHLHGAPSARWGSWARRINPSRYPHLFSRGFSPWPERRVYVSTGMGYSSIPFRLLARPEIVILDLIP